MKREVILVPQDKSVLNVLAEMEEQTKNSWIFFHRNVYRKLNQISENSTIAPDYIRFMWWGTNRKNPMIDLYLENFSGTSDIWIKVLKIESPDISFTIPSKKILKTFISCK